ncbi:hypothetical protein RND81_03G100100 [Saponaria officinalis]|uniref:Prolamin-like domain-containing protein n=1 Tax=Saponaria officinalis TaxID=3572 RepID=A0AAW1LZP5_SAPOF
MFKTIILISCIIVLSSQLGKASKPSNSQALDPQKCAQSVTKGAVCLTDIWTHFGSPSAACCKALDEISDSCLPSLFPGNPIIAQIFKSICSGGGGGGGKGSGTFPFPPFTLPFPFPFPPVGGGSGGLPFPFPFPPIGGGGSGGLPFPFPFPFPFPPIGGGHGGNGGASPPPTASPPKAN